MTILGNFYNLKKCQIYDNSNFRKTLQQSYEHSEIISTTKYNVSIKT